MTSEPANKHSATVTALFVYPVKSMRGIALDQARLQSAGLEHDRRFMVVSGDGRFVTQRDLHRLALVQTHLEGNGVLLSMPGQDGILVPFERTKGRRIQTAVWGEPCEAIDQGDEISSWLGAALQPREELRLVRMAPGFRRPQSQPELLGESTYTHFADAAPFLVANQSSLDELNRVLTSRNHPPVPMDRFRPNIVIQGPGAFAEHGISTLTGPDYRLRFHHPCQRCVVTTVDQQTAERNTGWQPYRTLCDINPMPGKENAPAFGHNASLAEGRDVQIKAGDRLTATGNVS